MKPYQQLRLAFLCTYAVRSFWFLCYCIYWFLYCCIYLFLCYCIYLFLYCCTYWFLCCCIQGE